MIARAAGSPSDAGTQGHPAARAWHALGHSCAGLHAIETLKERKRGPTGVYRLSAVGPQSSSVIAKRCALDDAEHERTLYENILPRLPLSSVRYYGFVGDAANSVGWLFLEDAGDTWYSPKLPHHRELAAKWLAVLHTHGRAAAPSGLPDRGEEWYRTRLQSAAGLLARALGSDEIDRHDASRLTRLAAWCATTAARWGDVVACCEPVPSTLVHADFVGENVRVRDDGAGLALLPFDWGTSGWGVPARDLVGVDIEAYYAGVREGWPAMRERDLRRLARVGRLFRKIAAVHRASMSLTYAPVDKVFNDLRFLLVRA